jgi:hypothetical protein
MRVVISGLLAALALSGVGIAQPAPATPAAVEAAFQAALLRSPTPLSVRQDQADYLRERAEAPGAEFVEAADEGRLERLMRSAEVDLRAATAAARLDELVESCLDLGAVDGCDGVAGGWLTGPEGRRLFWQIQGGSTEEDGITGGVLLLTETNGRLEPAAWAFRGSSYDPPVLFQADGGLFVAVPGATFGAGRGDADLLFRWTPGAERPLTQIDSWSWRDDLAAKLPGLHAFGRVRIDYAEMVALTELWREGDAGCCGTGGHVLIDFAILDGRLAVSEARLRDR